MTAVLTDAHSIRKLLGKVEQRLREAGILAAQVEAEWLLAGVLDVARTELYLREEPVPKQVVEEMWAAVQRRLRGEPLQYIVGCTEFYGHRLAVSPAVLIPRPETERLVEDAIQWLRQRRMRAPAIVEVGAGSGNIAISLAEALHACRIVGIELSWEALCVARENARRHGLSDRIRWVQADWTCGVNGPFDLVISNPPYVPTEEARRLQERSELAHEPWLSVDGGPDGMAFHRRLFAEAPRLLSNGGALCCECAESQAGVLAEALRGQPWARRIRVIDDLAGRPRGVWVDTWTP